MQNIETVIDKIQKLRRLATSSNENEAALAAAKAAEMIATFQIEEAQLQVTAEDDKEPVEGYIVPDELPKPLTVWERVLMSAVAKSTGCFYYIGHGRRAIFIGRRSDVRAAVYLYGLVAADINRLAKANWLVAKNTAWESPRRWLAGFRYGAATTVTLRLREQHTKATDSLHADASKSNALVVINKRAERIRDIKASLGLRSARRVYPKSHDGYDAGRTAGQSVNLGGRAVAALPAQRKAVGA